MMEKEGCFVAYRDHHPGGLRVGNSVEGKVFCSNLLIMVASGIS